MRLCAPSLVVTPTVRNIAQGLGGSERGAGLRVGAQAAVGHEVVVGPRSKLCAPRDPLADEPRLLEASLLGHVLHVRLGLDAVEVRVGEEPVRELTLRVAETLPLERFRDAYARLERGGQPGKIVLTP